MDSVHGEASNSADNVDEEGILGIAGKAGG
jgi:hypothetical protein